MSRLDSNSTCLWNDKKIRISFQGMFLTCPIYIYAALARILQMIFWVLRLGHRFMANRHGMSVGKMLVVHQQSSWANDHRSLT